MGSARLPSERWALSGVDLLKKSGLTSVIVTWAQKCTAELTTDIVKRTTTHNSTNYNLAHDRSWRALPNPEKVYDGRNMPGPNNSAHLSPTAIIARPLKGIFISFPFYSMGRLCFEDAFFISAP